MEPIFSNGRFPPTLFEQAAHSLLELQKQSKVCNLHVSAFLRALEKSDLPRPIDFACSEDAFYIDWAAVSLHIIHDDEDDDDDEIYILQTFFPKARVARFRTITSVLEGLTVLLNE